MSEIIEYAIGFSQIEKMNCSKCGKGTDATVGEIPICFRCYIIHYHKDGSDAGYEFWEKCEDEAGIVGMSTEEYIVRLPVER